MRIHPFICVAIGLLAGCASAVTSPDPSGEAAPESFASQSSALNRGDTLWQNQRLNDGDYLISGSHRLVMQHDCNLVLYDDRGAPWYSHTNGGGPGCFAIMQGDGNFVIYQPNGHAVWDSGTRAGDRIVMQTDGNIVIYDDNRHVPTWATNTVEPPPVVCGGMGTPCCSTGGNPGSGGCYVGSCSLPQGVCYGACTSNSDCVSGNCLTNFCE